jgi:hypothetical protein
MPSAAVRELPATREALLRAQVNCDRLQDFDECTRASQALELGNTGPPDLKQAKRFQKIALTQMVSQCESGSPHACFVLAAKFRVGTDLAKDPARAEVLEKRARDLCRFRAAPECPRP